MKQALYMWPLLLRVAVVATTWTLARYKLARAGEVSRLAVGLSWKERMRLASALSADSRLPVWARLAALLPALYVSSPIDLLPDVIPVLGRMDDALVFTVVFGLVAAFVPAPLLLEHLDATISANPPPHLASGAAAAGD